MGRRRHGGRAIGPRLSRVTKAAGARPPAGAGRRLTGINQVGERARGAGRAGSGRGVEVGARDATREPEDPRGEEAGTRRGRETRPTGRTDDRPPRPPKRRTRTPIARRTLVPARVAARRRRRHRVEETRRGGRRARLLLHPTPRPRREPCPAPAAAAGDGPGSTPPGRTTPGTADAPAASVRPPGPRGAGDAGRRGHGDRPAAGRPGDPTRTRAEPTGAGCGARRGGLVGGSGRATGAPPPPSSSTRRRRRTGGGGGAGRRIRRARPGSETRGAARGAADGEERTEAGGQTDGRTERGTDGVQPPEAEATEPAAEAGWPRATARATAQNGRGGGGASRPPGRTAGSHRQRPPSTGAVPRHTRDGGLAAPPPSPLTGPAPTTAYTHPRPQPAGENALPPRTGGPHGPHARNPACLCTRAPRPPPSAGTRGHCSARGRHRPTDAGGRHPREARPARSRQGEGARARRARADEEGRPAAAGRGRRARTAEAAGQGRGCRPGNRKTPGTRPGHRENQRGIPPPPTHGGGPATPGTPASPRHPRSGPHDPAPPPGPSDPEARHPGTRSGEAAQTVTARRHRLRLGGEGGRDRQAPPRHGCGDWGKPGPDRPGVAPPLPPPSPWARTTGAGRARARRTRARGAPLAHRTRPAQRGPAGPSPNSEGGGAGREKAFSPRARRPSPERLSFRPTEALHEPPKPSAGREGSAVQLSRRPTRGGVCTARAGAEPAPRPPQGPSSVSLHDEGEQGRTPAPLSYRLDPPQREPTHGTHSPPRRGPEEDTGLRETTPPLGLRHLRDNLERSRGTTEEQPRGTLTHPRGARERGSGTALPTAGEAGKGGKTGEGCRGQTEKSGHVHPERPSLVRHGLGSARESTTTPHRSQCESSRQRPPQGGPDTGHGTYGRGVVPATTGCPQRGSAQGRRPNATSPRRPRVARRPEVAPPRWVSQARHLGAGAQAQAGGSSGKGRIGRQPAVRRAQSPACIQRPKVLSGTPQTEKTVYRPVRVSERGFGFDGQKKKRRKNRRRGAPNETSGPGPGTAPGSQTVLDAAPRTARAGPHLLTGIQGVGAG
ncbi:collagen alpha-1(I) chain-like [Moschus berezovskii]|uniref:collagen alpha-1(I) chain-like n=1 Tax=Moschus berezovskii TaxID=68408 RepID=UPI002443CEB7|nr:collagen alpha-1(I) chain-like [Moschus berezovskii]